MKESVLDGLITARVLFQHAQTLCLSEDRHLATAGLVVLQDALEIVFLALLTENGVDERRKLENATFDQLIGYLTAEGVSVPKSGTLKALNKHRVLAKHYNQIADPTTVRGYLAAAELAIDEVLKQVIGKPLADILLTDLLPEGEARKYLEGASRLIADGSCFDALIEIRKAIFVEIERDYSVYLWRDTEESSSVDVLTAFVYGGYKAPYYTRNKAWIEKNVREPTDYVQIDLEQLRSDAIEWGINTAELQSIRNLTPAVFRSDSSADWQVRFGVQFRARGCTPENARYCLDRAISVLLKKHNHRRAIRYSATGRSPIANARIKTGSRLYSHASSNSAVVHRISDKYEYEVEMIVSGLEDDAVFLKLHGTAVEKDENLFPKSMTTGYLAVSDLIEQANN